MTSEHWKDQPEKQDYPAARSYLSLLVDPGEAKKAAKALADDPDAASYKAKDLLRAAGLPLLPVDDPEVAKDLAKVKAGTKLSPVLLVRGDPLWVADGYHRICASYHLDEDTEIPCRIVARPRVNTGRKSRRKAAK
jgi:hypothetical protein